MFSLKKYPYHFMVNFHYHEQMIRCRVPGSKSRKIIWTEVGEVGPSRIVMASIFPLSTVEVNKKNPM